VLKSLKETLSILVFVFYLTGLRKTFDLCAQILRLANVAYA